MAPIVNGIGNVNLVLPTKWLFPNTTTSIKEVTPSSIRYVVTPNHNATVFAAERLRCKARRCVTNYQHTRTGVENISHSNRQILSRQEDLPVPVFIFRNWTAKQPHVCKTVKPELYRQCKIFIQLHCFETGYCFPNEHVEDHLQTLSVLHTIL